MHKQKVVGALLADATVYGSFALGKDGAAGGYWGSWRQPLLLAVVGRCWGSLRDWQCPNALRVWCFLVALG
jgi:hypothetical protein